MTQSSSTAPREVFLLGAARVGLAVVERKSAALLYEQIGRTTPEEVAQALHRQAARLVDPAKVSRARIADHWRRG